MAITPIGSLSTLAPTSSSSAASASAGSSSSGQPFGDALARMMNKVEESGAVANDAVARMLDGTGDVHEAMIAIQQADTTFQFAVQVKNKLVQAYQDIMRMPV